MPPSKRPHAEVWIGFYLDVHGQTAAARPFLERSMVSRVIPEWRRALAGQSLRTGRR